MLSQNITKCLIVLCAWWSSNIDDVLFSILHTVMLYANWTSSHLWYFYCRIRPSSPKFLITPPVSRSPFRTIHLFHLTPSSIASSIPSISPLPSQVDPSGPLATLRKLLLSDESLASLQEWLQLHWWAVTLLLLAILVLLVRTWPTNCLSTEAIIRGFTGPRGCSDSLGVETKKNQKQLGN